MATYFDPIVDAVNISGSSNNILTKKGDGCGNATYGKKWFPSNSQKTMKWRFKLIGGKIGRVLFGVISNEYVINRNQYPTGGYKIKYLVQPCSPQTKIYDVKGYRLYGDINMIIGDTIEHIINFKTKTITLNKNNGSQIETIWNNISVGSHIKYRLLITLADDKSQLQLVVDDNEQQKSDDDKENENDNGLKQRMKILQNENNMV